MAVCTKTVEDEKLPFNYEIANICDLQYLRGKDCIL